MNILITSASRKVSLVRNFKKALKNNGKVIAMDISKEASALYFADSYIIGLRSDNPNFIDSILDTCKEHNINLIIPTRDEELSLFAKNKELFNENNIEVMVSDVDAIEICQNKNRFIEFCKNHNFSIPRTFNIDEISESDFPLFLKPVIGKGGLDTFRVDSIAHLKTLNLEDFIIQEFVDADEFTIDLFADFNGNVISAVPRERVLVGGGESLITKTFKNDLIICETVRLSESLGLKGHNTIQCFFDGESIKFIEVNPRFGGAASISFEAGANSAEFLLKILNNEKLEPQIGEFKDNLTSLRYIDDYFLESS